MSRGLHATMPSSSNACKSRVWPLSANLDRISLTANASGPARPLHWLISRHRRVRLSICKHIQTGLRRNRCERPVVWIRAALILPPDFTRVQVFKIHALEDTSKPQLMTTIEADLLGPPDCLRLSDRVARRARVKHHDPLLTQPPTSAFGDGIRVPDEEQLRRVSSQIAPLRTLRGDLGPAQAGHYRGTRGPAKAGHDRGSPAEAGHYR